MIRIQRACFIVFTAILAILPNLSTIANAQAGYEGKDSVSAHLRQPSGNVFHLSQVATCDENGAAYHDANLAISAQGPNLSILGRDLLGSEWSARLPISGLGCVIFQNDLDDNGQQDLVIYSPTIGDRGSYGTLLTLLLFDEQGKPFPWQAAGHFTALDGGILEMRRDSKGVAIIQTLELGLPSWGGISFVSNLYRLEDGRIIKSHETFEGIEFPYLIPANQGDSKIEYAASAIDFSTNALAHGEASPVQSADARFVRYGQAPRPLSTSTRGSSATGNVGNIVNPVTYPNAPLDTGEHMILSDGSGFDLPDILIIDKAAGSRQILFHPENTDLNRIEGGKYRIHLTGLNCSDPDDCQPFIVWAKE